MRSTSMLRHRPLFYKLPPNQNRTMSDDDYDAVSGDELGDALDEEFNDEDPAIPAASNNATQTPIDAEEAGASSPTAEKDEDAEKGEDDEDAGAREQEVDEFDDAFDEAFEEEDEGMADVGPSQEPGTQLQENAADEVDTQPEEAGTSEGPVKQAAKQFDEEADKKRRIISAMTDQQLSRYESYRRSSLARPKVKKVVSALLGYAVNDRSIIALCGMGKVFVGELIESARMLAAEEEYDGPLLPRHIHWAYQNLNCQHKIPRRQPKRRLLK